MKGLRSVPGRARTLDAGESRRLVAAFVDGQTMKELGDRFVIPPARVAEYIRAALAEAMRRERAA